MRRRRGCTPRLILLAVDGVLYGLVPTTRPEMGEAGWERGQRRQIIPDTAYEYICTSKKLGQVPLAIPLTLALVRKSRVRDEGQKNTLARRTYCTEGRILES